METPFMEAWTYQEANVRRGGFQRFPEAINGLGLEIHSVAPPLGRFISKHGCYS